MSLIEIRDVHKWYGEFHVLKGISERVDKGEVLVICGPSGSGKSSLIRCLNRLEPIQKGDILFEGTSIYAPEVDVNALRAEVGMVFQQFNLYPHLTVLENVTLAPIKVWGMGKKEATDLAMELLGRVGIACCRLIEGGMPGPPHPHPSDDHLHHGHGPDVHREIAHLDDEIGSRDDDRHHEDPEANPRETPRPGSDEHGEEDHGVGAHDKAVHARARRGNPHGEDHRDRGQGHPRAPPPSTPDHTRRSKDHGDGNRGDGCSMRSAQKEDERDDGDDDGGAPGDRHRQSPAKVGHFGARRARLWPRLRRRGRHRKG